MIKLLKQRQQILQSIRNFFDSKGFLEVDTPTLVNSPGMEPTLYAFKTKYFQDNGSSVDLYLPTSPEFHMKRLLSEGSGHIYQICKAFRNKEKGHLHSPEFTILEWYRSDDSYHAIMEDVEQLVHYTAVQLIGKTSIFRNAREISLQPPWDKKTMQEIWLEYTGIDILSSNSEVTLRNEGKKIGVQNLKDGDSWDILFFKIFLDRIEGNLGWSRPLIVCEYPACMAALARIKPDDPRIALRFEAYIAGTEIGNAFDELTDSKEQLRRFQQSQKEKIINGEEPFPIDYDLIDALQGMPPSAGIALGLDRLLMLLLDAKTIQEVSVFPFSTPKRDTIEDH